MPYSSIIIVTPALAAATSGNWQTAHRWAAFLRGPFDVRVAASLQKGRADALIALHAIKSAAAVQAWRARGMAGPVITVLSGTDLYGPGAGSLLFREVLAASDRIVTLNERGANRLPAEARRRTVCILQSCTAWQPAPKPRAPLRVIAVGHLRHEKSPQTLFDAAQRLRADAGIEIVHVGRALDHALGRRALALSAASPNYRWLGELTHRSARERIRRAHILVHPSRMEGGAHAVIEAVRSGTAVLASRIDGNVGLLGVDYEGYFPVGNADALAALLRRAAREPAFLRRLRAQCAARAPLFDPRRERAAVVSLLRDALAG